MFIPKPSIHRYSILDAGRLTTLFRSGEIFHAAGDDFSNIALLGAFVENTLRAPNVYILGADPRKEAFVYIPMHNTSCYGAHFVVREDARGKAAFLHLAESAKYLFQNTPAMAIMGFIREENRKACRLAGCIGMKRIGKTHGTLKFEGKMVNEVIYQCTVDDYNEKYGDTLGAVIKGA